MPFRFLKSVDLKTIGKVPGDISSGFGCEITIWKPTVEQPRAKEDFMSGWGFDDLGTGSETVHEFGGLEIGT